MKHRVLVSADPAGLTVCTDSEGVDVLLQDKGVWAQELPHKDSGGDACDMQLFFVRTNPHRVLKEFAAAGEAAYWVSVEFTEAEESEYNPLVKTFRTEEAAVAYMEGLMDSQVDIQYATNVPEAQLLKEEPELQQAPDSKEEK